MHMAKPMVGRTNPFQVFKIIVPPNQTALEVVHLTVYPAYIIPAPFSQTFLAQTSIAEAHLPTAEADIFSSEVIVTI